jgi:hypothetical protein
MQKMQNMQNMNRKNQCTKSGTWISFFTSWKVRTTLLPHPNPLCSALSLPLASICCGAALLDTVLHWQLTHKHN